MKAFCGFPAINSRSVRRDIVCRKSSGHLLNIIQNPFSCFRIQTDELLYENVLAMGQLFFFGKKIQPIGWRRGVHLAIPSPQPFLPNAEFTADRKNGLIRNVSLSALDQGNGVLL